MSENDDAKTAHPPVTEGVRIIGAQPAGGQVADAPATTENAGSAALPHWTAPPTGEVPRIFSEVAPPKAESWADDDADDSWSAFTTQSPRWRDTSSDWSEADDVRSLGDDGPKLGALDTERSDKSDFLEFDFVDEPSPRLAPPVEAEPSGVSAPASGVGTPRPTGPTPTVRIGDTGRGIRPVATTTGGVPRVASGSTGQMARPSGNTGVNRRPNTAGATGPASGRPGRPGAPAHKGAERDLPVAIGVGVALGFLAVVAIKAGPRYGVVLVALALALCAAEFYSAARKVGYQPANLLGIAATAALPLAVYWRGTGALPAMLGLTVVATFVWHMWVNREQPTANVAITLAGVMYIGVLGSYAAMMLRIPKFGQNLLLITIIAVVAVDTGGLLVGRTFGHTKLAPTISPNKTTEGTYGAVFICLLVTLAVGRIFHLKPWDHPANALKLGIVVAVLSLLGDLSESLVKRDLGIKDMGAILPGHGGALDRFDALLFALPGAYYLAHSIHFV